MRNKLAWLRNLKVSGSDVNIDEFLSSLLQAREQHRKEIWFNRTDLREFFENVYRTLDALTQLVLVNETDNEEDTVLMGVLATVRRMDNENRTIMEWWRLARDCPDCTITTSQTGIRWNPCVEHDPRQ